MTAVSVEIPKFNFTGSSIKTDDEFNKQEGERSGGQYLRPGRHEVVITKVEYKGPATDPNWGKFTLTLTGTGDKTTRYFIMVPFRDVMYVGKSGKPTGLMYKKFKDFMGALGVNLTVDSLGAVLPTYFSRDGEALLGGKLAIELGYDGNYIKYAGKNEDGTKRYEIALKDGSVLLNKDTMQPVTFPDPAAAEAFATSTQIIIQKFPDILEVAQPAGGPSLSATKAAW